MSYKPNGFALKLPTGAVNAWPSEELRQFGHVRRFVVNRWEKVLSRILSMDTSSWGSLPFQYRVVVPARQAYSHSASVGSRYVFPSLPLSHAQNAFASFQLTLTTGCSIVCSSKPHD